MDDADRGTGFGVEEQDETLMGLDAFGKVLVEDADELGTEGGVCPHSSGHDAEEAAFGEGEDSAKVLHGFASGESDHGSADDGNAYVVGEAAGDFFAVNESHKAEYRGVEWKGAEWRAWPVKPSRHGDDG